MLRKFDWNIIHICAPHLPFFSLGNPKKSHSFSYSYITLDYFRHLRRKHIETVVLQLKLFTYCCSVLPKCLLSAQPNHITASGERYRRSACIDYRVPDTDELRQRLVATWAEFQQSVVYDATDQCWKDCKQVSIPKVVISNICCDVACGACLTFQLPHITTGFFRATNI